MPRHGGGHRGGGRRGPARGFRHAYRRPVVIGGGYVWNGLYWVAPNGACYTKDDEGVYTLVDCSAEGVGGTADSSSFDADVKRKKSELREGGPLNKTNLRDLAIGIGIGALVVWAVKKYKLIG